MENVKKIIEQGKTYLGIELGSTRIKATLIDDAYNPVASGSFDWENDFSDGYWTYELENVRKGVQECFKNLAGNVSKEYGVAIETVGAIGISAMMHGYLAFDEHDNLLVPFRTWRNTTTKEAADILTKAFNFNIPQRWSIAHLYQAILNNEAHISKIRHITTLAGYVHYILTGKREIGIGDASGMFPVKSKDYNEEMLNTFNEIVKDKNLAWNIRDILPKIKVAGESGACLLEAGAKFLDPTGTLKCGIPVCAPEGDADTGMVATNSVLPRTGNISAGTSIFSMLVLEKTLEKVHREIDIVTTPDGSDVAMVHCNNCCGELDTWVNMFDEFAELIGIQIDKSTLYELLYRNAMSGDASDIVAYNYLSGEHITKVSTGRPMYFRMPECKMGLAGFMKAQLYSAFATLKIGMDILFGEESIKADQFFAHGGLFKVPGVAQQILANALNTPISVMETASEGGAWGMALLAAFMINKKANQSLGEWLKSEVFSNMEIKTLKPRDEQAADFEKYMKRYRAGLGAEMKLEEVQ